MVGDAGFVPEADYPRAIRGALLNCRRGSGDLWTVGHCSEEKSEKLGLLVSAVRTPGTSS